MKKRKILAALLAVVVGVSAFAGCNRQVNNEGKGNIAGKNETNATVIKVHNYDCGYGRGYIEETAAKFAELVQDVSYEPGKTGVFFKYIHTQINATGTYLLDSLKNNEYDIFFTNTIQPDLVKNSYTTWVRDVSDLVNQTTATPNHSRFAEDESILDRMHDDYADYYSEEDGSFYVMPIFSSSALPIYDVQLCEDRNLYIAEQGSNDTHLEFTGDKAQGCKGPDNVKGTEDDGLPETLAQLYLWFDHMSDVGVTPMIWSGQFPSMNTYAWSQLWADYEGYEQARAIYTFDGQTPLTNLISVDDEGNITDLEDEAITPENGYIAMRQMGRYIAAQFYEKVTQNRSKWVDDRSYSPSESHTMAQSHYIGSTYSKKPIMILGEWNYWEAEATSTFDSYASRHGDKTDRKFACLPLPKYDRSMFNGDEKNLMTITYGTGGVMFLKNGIEESRVKAVEDFYMYFNSSEAMGVQNREGAQPRPFDYELSSEVQNTMSNFAKDVYRIFHSDEDIKLVSTLSRNDFTTANYDHISEEYGRSSMYLENSNLQSTFPFMIMKDDSRVTAISWFEGLERCFTYKTSENSKSLWDQMLDRIK